MSASCPAGRRSALVLLALVLAAGACEDDPTGPTVTPTRELTVFASDSAYVALGDPSTPASASTPWDVGFWRTAVFLQGSGTPVMAVCVCQNAGASDEQIMAMTPASELAEFEAVAAADVPAGGAPAWSATAISDSPWYKYNLTGQDRQIWPTYEVYLVRKGSEVYKLQLTGYYDGAGEPRHVTFRYARIGS